jgi:hypothetical protein
MIIEVNCNNDSLEIKSSSYKQPFEFDVKYPTQVIKILEELINLISEDRETLGIQLVKIDEDTKTTIGEW